MGIETAAVAATVLGTAVSAYSAYSQGQAQSKAADYQAAIDRNNATIAGWNAQIATDAQAQKTQEIERQGTLRLAAQRAALGATGVTLDSGSALDVQSATVQDTARAASVSAEQGALAGYGFTTQKQNFLDQGTMSEAAGANASTASFINAGSTLLSGAGQVAGKWYQWEAAKRLPKPADPGYA